MDFQITYPNKLFKTVKLRGLNGKFFIFKNKYRVMKVALIPQIIGYIIFIIGLVVNIRAFFLRYRVRIEDTRNYGKSTFVLLVLLCVYVFVCAILDKIFNYNRTK